MSALRKDAVLAVNFSCCGTAFLKECANRTFCAAIEKVRLPDKVRSQLIYQSSDFGVSWFRGPRIEGHAAIYTSNGDISLRAISA